MTDKPLPTLDAFVRVTKSSFVPRTGYVMFPGFKPMYIRCTQHIINGIRVQTLDFANIEAMTPGRGAFTKLFKHCRKKYPTLILFVECVLNERFAKKLLSMGFVQLDNQPAPSFYHPFT